MTREDVFTDEDTENAEDRMRQERPAEADLFRFEDTVNRPGDAIGNLIDRQGRELVRLRAIEEAARALVAFYDQGGGLAHPDPWKVLRAALEGAPHDPE